MIDTIVDGNPSSKGFCPFSLFLFVGSAFSFVRHLQYKSTSSSKHVTVDASDDNDTFVSADDNEPFRVIFVLGGPGAGKGTQCQLLSENIGWAHLSAGDLLRAERQKAGSDLADIINSNISAGKIVPSEITVLLINNAMEDLKKSKGQTKFLIDGFPRNEGNVNSWREVIGNRARVEKVLFLECPEDILTSRLLERSKTSGRNDDSIDVIRKRFVTYREESMPIIQMYQGGGKVRKIIADRSIEEVYRELESIVEE